MAIRETSSETVEIGEPADNSEDGHRKMCFVCGKQIEVDRAKWERGEPVHGECKLGWGIV